jgi:gas vesicle protein
MYDESQSNGMMRGTSATIGFVLGAVVGAGIALLLAPAPGTETRRRLGQTARRLGDNARETMSKGREAMGQLRDDAKTAIGSARDAFRHDHNETGSESFVPSGARETVTRSIPRS